MMRVVGIDHLSIRVSDYQKSKQFYSRLFTFLGFELSDEYADAIGWTNGKTRFWISPADATGLKHANTASATWGFITMRFSCAAARMSTRCKTFCGTISERPSLIRQRNIMTTITRCSSLIPTA